MIFIDGLGLKQFQYFDNKLESNTLSSLKERGIFLPVKSVIPSETFASTYSIFSGKDTTEHPFVGNRFCIPTSDGLKEFDLKDREGVKKARNEFQKDIEPNFFEVAEKEGYNIRYISQAADESRFTKDLILGGCSGVSFTHKSRLGEIFKTSFSFISNSVEDDQNFVLQIYIDEADRKWHDDGPYSHRIMEEISDKIGTFLGLLANNIDLSSTLLVIFSDHGIVRTPLDIFYEELEAGERDVLFESGMRYTSFYLDPPRKGKAEKIGENIDDDLDVIIKRNSKWSDSKTFPDLLIYPKSNLKFSRKEKIPEEETAPAFQHFGVHGGASFDERFGILTMYSLGEPPE
ncbi:hypothetical protein AKJ66_01870 [candidate division MSBL1 archaeon SCGC-AAA259E22]|uniref:Phosphodiesterase n=1 Tax=candidate division MSBL1 archaeon SCGC-AAA259E22 TaxID=1698265 RepID=A0A133UH59_9EURY|nr:hypothetical protein AKJ66_01870 [candidate division MSBL1 archaeon SCGC-AAA259E22]